MAGRQASNTITRYAGLQVQTSALGVNIPVGWGTFRCKCNLVDYLDFKSIAQKAAASGKGGSTVTGYSYSASIILALCEGPIDSVSTVYVNSNIYINGATTALAQVGLTLNTGAIGQSVWSYLTSNHPDHAIGYSGLAIAYASNYALDSGAGTPNHSFEVVRTSSFGVGATPDADPSLVLSDFLTNARYGVPSWGSGLIGSLTQFQNYTLAAGLLVSPVIDAQRSASDFLTELFLATNSTCVWSEGVLKVIPYGDTALSGNGKTFTPNVTPVYSLNDDNFAVDASGDPPLQVDILDQSDAYNVVQLEYLDRTNQYNMAIALASDAANVAQYGMRRKDPDTVHCICTPAVAAISAQLFLQRTLYVRAQYKFKLGWMFAILEPGDIVELTDVGMGLNAYPVRIVQIDEDEKYGLQITAEDAQIGVANAPAYTMQNSLGYQVNQNVDPGGVEANLLLWSGDASNAAYTKTNLTVTANTGTDQYGLTTADTLTPTVSTGAHSIKQAITTFAGVAYTYSVCLKKNAHKNARVAITDSGGTNGGYIDVDTNAGIVLTAGSAVGTGIVVGAVMQATLVAGIWQVILTVQVPGVTTLYPAISVLSDAGAVSWTGDGSSALYVSQQAFRQGLLAGAYAATTTGAASPLIFNAPSVITNNGSEVWAAVAGGPNWGGANIWTGIDGSNYQEVATISAPCRYGLTTTAFPAGGNMLRFSTDLTNTTWWGPTNATITGGQADPLGGTTAILWTRAGSGLGFIFQPLAGSSAGQTLTFSVYLKGGSLTGSNVVIDIQDQSVPVIYGTATVTLTGSWVRYSVTATFPAGAANGTTVIVKSTSGSGGDTMYVGFPQLEIGTTANTYVATTGAMPASGDPDTLYSLGVDIGQSSPTVASPAQLASATQAVADANGTLCLIDGELISYATATLTNPAQYSLTTYIRRGVLGTTIAAHTTGAPFVRLDGTPVAIPYTADQGGKTLHVKFQSFNLWGMGVQSLSDCIDYTFTTGAQGAAQPTTAAWVAVGTTFSNAGQAIPAIVIIGASDNPSADSVAFWYRVTGTTAWSGAGNEAVTTTRKEITSVTSGTAYDVGVSYVIAGVPGAILLIGTVTVGTLNAGSAPTTSPTGAVLLSDSAAGSRVFTFPSTATTQAYIEIWGPGGYGVFYSGAFYGGGGGGYAKHLLTGITPGTTTLAYTIGQAAVASTVTSPALNANPGFSAITGGGAGGTASGGGVVNTTGQAGTGSYGGGAAPAFSQQSGISQGGTTPGGGGYGADIVVDLYGDFTAYPAPGANGAIVITAA